MPNKRKMLWKPCVLLLFDPVSPSIDFQIQESPEWFEDNPVPACEAGYRREAVMICVETDMVPERLCNYSKMGVSTHPAIPKVII